MLKLKLSDTDIKKVLTNHLVVIVDKREKEWSSVEEFFKSKNIKYQMGTNETGDYTVEIEPNDIIGNTKPLMVSASVERKGSLSELIGNLKEDRFENELIRSQALDSFVILVEGACYEDIVGGNYRSEYKPQAAVGRLKTWELEYGFSLNFASKEMSGRWIYIHLYYAARAGLKKIG